MKKRVPVIFLQKTFRKDIFYTIWVKYRKKLSTIWESVLTRKWKLLNVLNFKKCWNLNFVQLLKVSWFQNVLLVRQLLPKNQRNYFWISALKFFCSFLGASWKLFGLLGDLVSNIINKEGYWKPKKLPGSPQKATKKFRAEIQKYFRWYFGWNWFFIRTFWN